LKFFYLKFMKIEIKKNKNRNRNKIEIENENKDINIDIDIDKDKDLNISLNSNKSENYNKDNITNENVNDINNNNNINDLICINIPDMKINEYTKVRFISNYKLNINLNNNNNNNKINNNNKDQKNPENNSLIIHIHGGGFIAMSSASHEMYTRKWAKYTNVPIMSIDYRLAPDNPYPKSLDDVYQAYIWILKNAENQIGIKPEKIILVGDSAGGNLVSSLTNLLIIKGEILPKAIFLIYPALKISMKKFSLSLLNVIDDKILPYHLVKYCLESYRSGYKEEDDPYLSPIFVSEEVLKYYPPCRIYIGSNDPLRDDSYLFLRRLM
jgi:acetyl esterase/lipase